MLLLPSGRALPLWQVSPEGHLSGHTEHEMLSFQSGTLALLSLSLQSLPLFMLELREGFFLDSVFHSGLWAKGSMACVPRTPSARTPTLSGCSLQEEYGSVLEMPPGPLAHPGSPRGSHRNLSSLLQPRPSLHAFPHTRARSPDGPDAVSSLQRPQGPPSVAVKEPRSFICPALFPSPCL